MYLLNPYCFTKLIYTYYDEVDHLVTLSKNFYETDFSWQFGESVFTASIDWENIGILITYSRGISDMSVDINQILCWYI